MLDLALDWKLLPPLILISALPEHHSYFFYALEQPFTWLTPLIAVFQLIFFFSLTQQHSISILTISSISTFAFTLEFQVWLILFGSTLQFEPRLFVTRFRNYWFCLKWLTQLLIKYSVNAKVLSALWKSFHFQYQYQKRLQRLKYEAKTKLYLLTS